MANYFLVMNNSKVKTAVRISNYSISNYFDCMNGVRQGCVLSPFLLVMFISEIRNMLEHSELRGYLLGKSTYHY